MLKEKLLETIEEYKMLEPGDHVLLAVSGGPDSTALLFLLDSVKEQLNLKLHVAHLNHNIRKADSELDVRYVQGLAQRLKVPVTVETFDVQSYAKNEKMGLEEAARHLRYAFFERVANQVGANKIAVGHSADDNVETFLMRLLRGSGIKGLCGIPPKRGNIVRPMIRIWRRQIEDYVGALKLVPRRDYTNYESKYLRNRVRLKLIPQLKIYNLNIKEIISQTILLLTDDREYLEAKAEEALAEAFLSSEENKLVLSVEGVSEWETPVQGHMIRKAIEKIKGNLLELSYKHIANILEKLEAKAAWELHLPGGIYVSGNGEELVISREKPKEPVTKQYSYSLTIPGELEIKEINRKLKAELAEKVEKNADNNVAFVDYDQLGKNLVIRSKEPGDRFNPFGMKGSKKLQDLFVDEKLSPEQRNAVPVIVSNGRIVWVGGVRLDDRSKVTKNTKKIVKLELL